MNIRRRANPLEKIYSIGTQVPTTIEFFEDKLMVEYCNDDPEDKAAAHKFAKDYYESIGRELPVKTRTEPGFRLQWYDRLI